LRISPNDPSSLKANACGSRDHDGGEFVITTSADSEQEALLDRVRRLEPRQILRLGGLWAGVHDGQIDADRQRDRRAAGTAVRVLTRDSAAATPDGESMRAAAAAVRDALGLMDGAASVALRGAFADATFAITDALDAIRLRTRLSSQAFDELVRPWQTMLAEIDA
jgi:hypothetical protein